MKICIIGASGYIGSMLHRHLILGNHNIHACDMNPLTPNVVKIKGSNIPDDMITDSEIIIYLGGLSGRMVCFHNTQQKILEENIDDMIQIAKKMSPHQLLIYATTAGILEGSHDVPMSENFQFDKSHFDPYVISMLNRELAVKELPITSVGLRFGTIIGHSPKQRKDLVHIAMIRSAVLDHRIDVYNPQCCRAILWNKDMYRAFDAIIENKYKISGHYVFNLASLNITIGKIAQDIGNLYGIMPQVKQDNGKSGFSLDTSKFCNFFKFQFLGTQELILRDLMENVSHLCIGHKETSNICRVCKHNNTTTVLDMGNQPLANNYVVAPISQEEYPLCLIRCRDCCHTQLNYSVEPGVLFKNYQYNSNTSQTIRQYFAWLAKKCTNDIGYIGKVIEIACNDGSQLDEFKQIGWETYGVDPASNLIGTAIDNGHDVRCGFWGVDTFDLPTPDVIVAQNVIAHVPDPVAFLKACAMVASHHTIIYVQTSQSNMYRNGEFDTIYHEHMSFFLIASMMKAAESVGLVITEVTKQPIHGTSYLFQMRLQQTKYLTHSTQTLEMWQEEKNVGLYDDLFYHNYRDHVMNIKIWVLNTIANVREEGYSFVAYGAAAKGMTLLNFYDVHGIEYIADDAPMKHGKYTPGTNILIVPPQQLASDDRKLAILVLAWNFLDEIIMNVKNYRGNKKTIIIQTFPEQKLFTLE